jgi:dynein light intermediate chain 1
MLSLTIIIGGSSDLQREFLEALSIGASVKRTQDRHGSRQPPMANSFALGYTYYDVLDADHEGFLHIWFHVVIQLLIVTDILARLSLYLLADPSPSFTPLLRPLLTPQTIPNTLVVILLDWTQPWLWIKQLKDWIKLLRSLVVSLDEQCRKKMEEVIVSWRDRGRGNTGIDIGGNSVLEGDVTLPLGPGEWDEALGLPLCVVCQNVRFLGRGAVI